MAETVHLYLKANGTDIKGDSSQTSLGRENSIECVYFEQAVKTAREAGSGMATGRRQYEPLLIRKRIDKSSPLIAKALVENTVIEGEVQVLPPEPHGRRHDRAVLHRRDQAGPHRLAEAGRARTPSCPPRPPSPPSRRSPSCSTPSRGPSRTAA
jgi:hypothetical protein